MTIARNALKTIGTNARTLTVSISKLAGLTVVFNFDFVNKRCHCFLIAL